MAYYFTLAALAAVATLSPAAEIEDGEVGAPKGFPSDTSPLSYSSCPNPYWADIGEYHTYPYEYDVQWYWKCGNQHVLEKCPVGTVFNQEYHYCDHEKETSKNFVCPRFRHSWSGYRLFPDPNFKYQYHKCYNENEYPSERKACPYDHIFDKHTSRCEYAYYTEARK